MEESRVHLRPGDRDRLHAWAEAGYPREACGLLVGRQEPGRVWIERVVSAPNLNTERARDRYELDPGTLMRTDAAARDEGLEIVGIWHSHPDHPAMPSETDRVQAWEGWSYVIVAVRDGRTEALRCWRLASDAFREEKVETWQT